MVSNQIGLNDPFSFWTRPDEFGRVPCSLGSRMWNSSDDWKASRVSENDWELLQELGLTKDSLALTLEAILHCNLDTSWRSSGSISLKKFLSGAEPIRQIRFWKFLSFMREGIQKLCSVFITWTGNKRIYIRIRQGMNLKWLGENQIYHHADGNSLQSLSLSLSLSHPLEW